MSKNIMQTEKNLEQLLIKLGEDKQPYPKDLLNSRRAAYLSQVSSVVGSGPHLTKGNGQGGPPQASTTITPVMKVVLTALIAANVALASYLAVTAYENWDKVQEFLFGAPSVSETSLVPSEIQTQLPETATTPEIAPSPEGTVTPVSTPEPTIPVDDLQSSNDDPVDNPQVGTPEPDNPGKHLGQTPHPEEPPGQQDKDKKDKDKKKP